MKLISKILLGMFPIVLPVMGFTWSYYQLQMQAAAEQVGHIASLVSDSGGRELNGFLRSRASEFALLRNDLNVCKDDLMGGNYALLARDALMQARGFSALVITDSAGRVTHTRLTNNRSNRHVVPHSIGPGPLLPPQELATIKAALAEWQDRIPALRHQKSQAFMDALRLESKGEVNSPQYLTLQTKTFNLTQLLKTPPTHVGYAGGEQAVAMGLPFKRDTYLFTQPLLGCDDELQGYLTAFLDRTQMEDILVLLRKSLTERGLVNTEVALIGSDLHHFESDAHLLKASQLQLLEQLPDNGAEYFPPLGGFISATNIADEAVLGEVMRQDSTSERSFSDEDYNRLIADSSRLHLLVFVAESEWLKRGQALLLRVSIWFLGSMLFLLLLVYFLARHIVEPIIRLKASVQKVAEGDRSVQAAVSSNDEVGQLAQAFNKMTAALQSSEGELKRLATVDPLTGLLNRRALAEEAFKERQRANRRGSSITVAMLDLDYFKRINDRYGHNAGDMTLQVFSALLQQQLRITDLISRIGGEEFVIVLPDTDEQSGHMIIDKLKDRLAAQDVPLDDGCVIHVTFSAGVVEWHNGDDFESVLNRADKKLYQAKEAGRNRVIS